MPSEFTELHQNQCKNPKFSGRHAPRPLNGCASSALMFFDHFYTINSCCAKFYYSGHSPFSKASDVHVNHQIFVLYYFSDFRIFFKFLKFYLIFTYSFQCLYTKIISNISRTFNTLNFIAAKLNWFNSMFVFKNISRHHVMGKYKSQPFTIQSFTIYLLKWQSRICE